MLQDSVLSKFSESLRHGGFLCLGNRESLNFTAIKPLFEAVDKKQRIFRKCGLKHAA
jgi:chemotaxis protein methyltransferase CheR